MRTPLLIWCAMASQAVPAVALVVTPQRTRPAILIAVGSLVSVAANVVGRILAATAGNNQIVSYLSSPLTAVCFLGALQLWQSTARERQIFKVGTWLFLATWILLVAFVEDMRNFDLVTGPLNSLTFLVAGAWTMIRRAQGLEATPLTQVDWFWVAGGIAINGAATAVSSPLGAILIERREFELFSIAWQVRAFLVTISFLAISWGIYRGPMVSKFSTIGTTEA